MSDNEVQVKFSADVKDLLSGLKDAQDHLATATEGMKGDLGSLIETFDKFGAGALAIGGVGLALEGLKEGFDYVQEASKQTYELAESFKKLGYETGASLDEMNQYTASIELSGGSTEDLTSLMQGMQRGIRANSDDLIANGVAANKAALDGMSFVDYLKKVHEIAEQMATPTEREQFLIMALGRSGATAGPMLHEFIENLQKAKGVTIISPESMKLMEETKESLGRLKIAQQEYAATVSSTWTPIGNFFRDLHTSFLQGQIDSQKAMDAYKAIYYANEGTPDMAREKLHAQGISGGGMQEEKKHLQHAQPEQTSGLVSDLDASMAAMAKKGWADLEKELDKDGQKDIDRAKAVTKEEQELEKLGVEDKLNASRMTLAQQKANLDQEVAMGALSVKQEIAQRKELLAQETAIETEALQKRLQDDTLSVVEKAKVENQIMALHRKSALDMDKLDKDQAKEWKRTIDEMTSGWTSSIMKMVNGQETFKKGIKSMALEVGESLEKMFIQMGLDAAKNYAISLLTAQTTNVSAATSAAALYAINAGASVAEIPVTGWAMAPGVMAQAYAEGLTMAGLASAAGGWWNVPSDNVTQIHKGEHVLPSDKAKGLDNLIQGGGGGGTHLHVQAMDAKSFSKWMAKASNQGALMHSVGKALRSGRMS